MLLLGAGLPCRGMLTVASGAFAAQGAGGGGGWSRGGGGRCVSIWEGLM